MLKVEVLIREFITIDGFTSVASAGLVVTALQHEVGDHTVENRAAVANALLAGAQGSEILGGFWHYIIIQLELDGRLELTVDGGLEEHFGAQNTRSGGKLSGSGLDGSEHYEKTPKFVRSEIVHITGGKKIRKAGATENAITSKKSTSSSSSSTCRRRIHI